jgi:hypothetical protein
MDYYRKSLFNSHKPLFFLTKPTYVMQNMLNEDGSTLVPRFRLKNTDIFDDFPSNTDLRFNPSLIQLAISYGMILEVDYKGEEDGTPGGHKRTIYPMVFGYGKDKQPLIRGFHLNGWSVSQGGELDKTWRMFRADRIVKMVFTGAFYRMAPDGYNPDGDAGIQKIVKQADFDEIRRNQQRLLDNQRIDVLDRVVLNKVRTIEAEDMKFTLQMANPFQGDVIPKKDAKNIRITIAKPLTGQGDYIALIGASIGRNNIFKLKIQGRDVGSYRVVKWMMADKLSTPQNIDNKKEFKCYMFKRARL